MRRWDDLGGNLPQLPPSILDGLLSFLMDLLIVIDDLIVVVDLLVVSIDASLVFKSPRRVGLSASCLSPYDPAPSGRSDTIDSTIDTVNS